MKLSQESTRRIRTQLLVFLVSFLLTLWFDQQGWLQRLEYAIFDVRLSQVRAETTINPQVKVVLIDESSLNYLSPTLGSFPWPRIVYAELLEFFAIGGAKAVLFDILFTEPEGSVFSGNEGASELDLILADASAGFPGTVHAMLLNRDVADEVQSSLHTPLPETFSSRLSINVNGATLSDELNSFTLPIKPIADATPYIGVVGVDPDSDGVYRRVKPIWEYQKAYFPGLSLTPGIMDNSSVELDLKKNSLEVGDRSIPLDDKNRLLINYYGDMEPISIARVFQSYNQLMSGEVEDLPLDPFEFENSIVYIGASAIGLDDVKAITNDPKAPGVYIHSAALSNIISDDMLTPAHARNTFMWTLAMSFISIILAFNVPYFSIKIFLLVGIPFGYWLFTGWQLENNIQLVFTVPVMGFALGWSWSFTYLSFTEGASKRRVKRMLSQYVSEAMLNEALESPDEILHAGVGKEETLTILFSDVRSFTKISENLPAERVVQLLNCHFSEMAETIFENQGTLDKFIGDAIMAYWGMPIKVEHHADHAVRAAMGMMVALENVNKELKARELPSIEIGVGLNTGNVVLGNIGSDRKLDYTVIGDAVNVASRMEGITKMYGVPIVVSESTRMMMMEPRPFLLLDHVRVKGKTEPMAIYTPLPDQKEDPEHWKSHCEQEVLSQKAFAYYQTQQWDLADQYYRQLQQAHVRALFLSRILEFRRQPPPPNWDGVYTFTSK